MTRSVIKKGGSIMSAPNVSAPPISTSKVVPPSSVGQCSNAELFTALKNLRKRESDAIAEIVLHLAEVDRRQIYRDAGHSSLFAYCTQALGYSEGAAQRRIIAARCLKEHPEVYQKLRSGLISLCALSEIARIIRPKIRSKC